ncbi:hypothetical protein B5G34_13770 [Flavonifractor sp. An82]|uniref:HdeD family acid-resistance protein n=1 Tax=Flavonifractor sp. An82 TaxID=1965660 RepID=UPI000B3A1DA9|nr:DUF308 domain-containing protein [Flavonifractor sp. An82]OUN20791.1 hypothetical protein B5G34_13770 [Flavonifractor sp. An82]
MKERLKNMTVSFVFLSVLYLLLGVVLLLWPTLVMDIISYAFGAILLLYGLFAIMGFYRSEDRRGGAFLGLFLGIVAAAVGAIMVLYPPLIQSIIPVILGLYIAIDGLLSVKRTLELQRMDYARWNVNLILSVISAALGIFVVFHPLLTEAALFRVIGVVLIYAGGSDLWTLFQLSRWTKEYRKTHPVDIDPIDL